MKTWLPFCLLTMLLISSSLPARADIVTALMGGEPSTARLDLDYQTDTYLNSAKRTSGDEPLQFLNVHAFFAPYKTSDWSVFTELKSDSLYTGVNSAVVGNETVPAPEYLYDQSLSVAATKKEADHSFMTASLEFGSASDRPFEESRDDVLSANLIWGRTPTAISQWIFIVNYSNNRGYLNNVPIPSFAYVYHPDRKFVAVWGLPFASFIWTEPGEHVYKIILFPTNLSAEATFQINEPLAYYSKLDFKTHSYMNTDRVNNQDRLFFEEKRIEAGLRSNFTSYLAMDLYMAFSFDRRLYEAESLFESEGQVNRIQNDYSVGTHLTLKL